MKSLLLKSVIALVVLSSCSTGKSFLHQRYTSLGHNKHSTQLTKPADAIVKKEAKQQPVETVIINTAPATEPVAVEQNANVLTASATHNVVLKRKPITRLAESGVVTATSKLVKKSANNVFNKQVKKEHKEKRGLLFGVINAVLSIIILVVVAFIIVFLVLFLVAI